MPDDIQRKLIHGYYAQQVILMLRLVKLCKAQRKGLKKNTIIVLGGDHGFHLGDQVSGPNPTNFEQSTDPHY
ncbi:MAG: hypothetical protein CM15mP121_2280 [Bacteroidota bacterium]|nr:MAG: hypothetical protein CM15mP121_2280 [Bacteroidota bacterium]